MLKYFPRDIFALAQVRQKYFPAKFKLLTLIFTTYEIAGRVAVDRCDKGMETVKIEKECCVHGYQV